MPINPQLPQRTLVEGAQVHLDDHNAINEYLNNIVEGQPGVPRGDWDIATAYDNPDIVTHEGSSYIARLPSTGSEPLPDNSNPDWQLLAGVGAAGATTLDALTDVNAPAPADGDALVWRDAGGGAWVPEVISAAHPDLATHDAMGLATDVELDGLADAVDLALAGKQALSEKGANNGYASLDAGGDVPLSQLGNAPGAITRIWIPASDFAATQGAPTLDDLTNNVWLAWLLDPGSAEGITTNIFTPADWATMDIDLWWTNAGAGSGNVVWEVRYPVTKGDGETMSGTVTATESTIAAPTQLVIKKSTYFAGVAVDTNEMFTLAVRRIAADGADTLGNDVGVLGVMLRKAS